MKFRPRNGSRDVAHAGPCSVIRGTTSSLLLILLEVEIELELELVKCVLRSCSGSGGLRRDVQKDWVEERRSELWSWILALALLSLLVLALGAVLSEASLRGILLGAGLSSIFYE